MAPMAPEGPPNTEPSFLRLEANEDDEKRQILDYMRWMKTANKSYNEKKGFWKEYLLAHHPDHHPEWRSCDDYELIIRQTALCDYVKRSKHWFMGV